MHIYNWILDVAPSLWFAAALEHWKQNSCHLHCGLFQHLLIQWCYSPHACCIMASNNSENTSPWRPGHKTVSGSPAPLKLVSLWRFDMPGVSQKHWARLSVKRFTTCHVQATRLPRLCSILDALILSDVHSSLWSTEIPVSRMQTISSICLHTHTHTGTQTTHIHSLKPLYLNLRCQVLGKMITQSSCHSATEQCCIWLLQNFYSGHEILWWFSTFVQFAQNCSYQLVIVEGPMWLDVLFNIRVKTFLFDKSYI